MTGSDIAVDEVCQVCARGTTLDFAGAGVSASLLVELLAGTPRRAESRIPALRLAGAVVLGPVALPGATVTALVEFTGCTLDEPIDLYAAELTGWRLTRAHCPACKRPTCRCAAS